MIIKQLQSVYHITDVDRNFFSFFYNKISLTDGVSAVFIAAVITCIGLSFAIPAKEDFSKGSDALKYAPLIDGWVTIILSYGWKLVRSFTKYDCENIVFEHLKVIPVQMWNYIKNLQGADTCYIITTNFFR